MSTNDAVDSQWYLTIFFISWGLMVIDTLTLFVVIFRLSIAMRHDTISSYLGSGSDGARLLAVMVIMTSWSLLGVRLLEWEHRRLCYDWGGSWVAAVTIVASFSLTITCGGRVRESAFVLDGSTVHSW